MKQETSSYPHVTVATVIEKDQKFLLVIEEQNGQQVFNQPAGHLELGETLIDAAKRETYEETGWQVDITHYLGVSQYYAPSNGVTYIRHSFVGLPVMFDKTSRLDSDIIDTTWKSYQEVLHSKSALRSTLVLNDIERYRSGALFALDNLVMGFF